MASIYDIANIQAGDPQERVGMSADKASASLNQYKHQKEIIADINAAYKLLKAKRKKINSDGALEGAFLVDF